MAELIESVYRSLEGERFYVASVLFERQFHKHFIAEGDGYLAGSYPDGTTTVEGAPISAKVRVLLRSVDPSFDGLVVAEVDSRQDGTWLVEGLNPALKYDVVGRKSGYNDVIMSNVSPEVVP